MKQIKKSTLGIILCLCMLFSQLVFMQSTYTADEKINITKNVGWHESAYIEWTDIQGADSYNVYIKPTDGAYTKLDDELVREYDGYFRADAVGLAAGNYLMKAVAVKNGAEITASESAEVPVSVDNYVREGFAFSENSDYGYTTGAYNKDGTLQAGAEVVYVSNENKDTVTINGDPSKGVGLNGILKYRESNKKDVTPLSIRLLGKVEMPEGVENYMLGIKDTKNVTFEGIGNDATVHGWGLTMKRACNIEVRNIGIMLYGGLGGDGDSLSLDTDNKNVFMHNIDFFYGEQGKDADQTKGDGSIDLKARSDYITASYNHFWDSGKTCVAGGVWEVGNPKDPRAKISVTYHHNWFDHSDSRHPRCVVANVHVYNNYYDGVGDYGVGAAVESSVFVENNYFRNVPRPMIIASQGSECYDSATDTYKDKGSLSGQTGGMIKEYGNVIITPRRFINQNNVPAGHDPVEIDAYSVSNRNDKVPESVKAKSGGWSYSNFDTDEAIMYDYSVESAEDAVTSVKSEAGRIDGGDFKWTFTDSDDSSKELDPELKAALVGYEDKIVTLYRTAAGSGEVTGPTTEGSEVTTDEVSTNETEDNTDEATTEGSEGTTEEIKGDTNSREWNFNTNSQLNSWVYNSSSSKGVTTSDGFSFAGNSGSDVIKTDGTAGTETNVKYLWLNGAGKTDTRNLTVSNCSAGDIISVWYGANSTRTITVEGGTADGDFVKTGGANIMCTAPVKVTATSGTVKIYASGGIGYFKVAVTPAKGEEKPDEPPDDGVPGDIDNDGVVTSNDAAIAYILAAKGAASPEWKTNRANVDNEAGVQVNDANEIMQKVLRASHKFPKTA